MRFLSILFLCSTWVSSTNAQFGVAGNRRQQQQQGGTKFQDLQQRAQQQNQGGAGGSMADINDLLGEAFNDPEMMKQYEAAMKELSKMSPEELEKQMKEVLAQLTDDDMLKEILKQKDQVIANLEATGSVPKDEIARYKTDDQYFEMKMRQSFEEMGKIFSNPDYLKAATEAMNSVADVISDPDKVFEALAKINGQMTDEDIETARLKFVSGEVQRDLFGDAFDTPEMQAILSDPTKWRESVREGYQNLLNAGTQSIPGANDEL